MANCTICGGKRRPGTEIKICTKPGNCLRAYNRAYRNLNRDSIMARQREWRAFVHPDRPARGEPMRDCVSLFFTKADIEAIEASKLKGECRSAAIRRLVRAGLEKTHK